MSVWPAILITLLTATPVEVTTLKGEQHVGSLERMSPDEVVLKTPTAGITIPAADLLSIRIPSAESATETTEASTDLRLIDGSRLRVTAIETDAGNATVTHSKLGTIKLGMTSIHSIRFAAQDPKVDGAWNQLVEKTPKKDQVALRKGDVLDHLDGVIGSLDQKTLKFQLDGDEIPVKRERLFGLIYAKRENIANKTIASVDLSTGERLSARSVSFEADTLKVKLVCGTEITIPQTNVALIDFSFGKITYLSNLEPREFQYTPFFDFDWGYRRDRMVHGTPISVGGKQYAKGLGLHSRTQMKYRIGGDYRRFQAVMGIDDSLREGGDVDVIIKGDGRVLFKGPVSIYERIDPKSKKPSERRPLPPVNLDLDVTGVVELEIVVDFGEMDDRGDCLNLADAKVIK